MVPRPRLFRAVQTALANNPVCALLGPRQCGKTTLARELAKSGRSHYFDLETAVGRARLRNPELTLAPLKDLVVIDEIQRLPDLFTALRPLADRKPIRARFLVTKSIHIAFEDLKLDRAWIVYPGNETYRIHPRVEATPLEHMLQMLPR